MRRCRFSVYCAVLADCLDREAAEDSATEYQRKSLVRADHLGLLHAR